jgi:hypothetical protein
VVFSAYSCDDSNNSQWSWEEKRTVWNSKAEWMFIQSDCFFYIKYNNELVCRVTFRLLVLVDFMIIRKMRLFECEYMCMFVYLCICVCV